MFGFTPAWWWASHRRRRAPLAYDSAQIVVVGTATEVDTAPPVSFDQTVAVGTAVEVDSAAVITAAGTGTTAQGGLAFLWSRPASLDQIVAVGTATETDTPGTVTVAANQTVTVGTAIETDTAPSLTIPSSQTITVGTATEVDSAPAIGSASIVIHPQGMVPGTTIGAYRRWEWLGPVAAKLNAGPGAAVQTTTVTEDLTASFTLSPGEYVAYASVYPTKRLFFMVTE